MTTGTQVICTLRPMDARPVKTYKGTVTRVDPAEDGWEAGLVVHYPKLKSKSTIGVDIFHVWPSPWVREA